MEKRTARFIIAAVTLISLYFLYEVVRIEFKYDFRLFYPKDDDNTAFFKAFQERFESDRDFILIGLVNEGGIYDEVFLQKVDRLTSELESLEHVEAVISPTNAMSYRILPLYPGIYKQKILRYEEPEFFSIDSAKLHSDENYANTIVSENGKAICLIVEQRDNLDQEACFEISESAQGVLESHEFDEKYIAGRCLGLTVYVNLIRNEVRVFVGSSVALILLFLFISYRSFWGLWMPASVVLLTVLWTMGLMSATGKPIDLISNIIPTMLLVIGISNVIHLLSRFLDHLREGLGKSNALRISIREVGLATVFTSTTTAIGFLSLTTSRVQPVIDMGLYTTIGLGFAFLLSYTWFPAIITLNKDLSTHSIEESDNFWFNRLDKFFEWLFARKRLVLAAWALLAIIGIALSMQLRVNSQLLDGLDKDHPQRLAFNFFEEEFSGARPFELSLEILGDRKDLDHRHLLAMDSIQEYLDTVYGVGNIQSPVTVFKNLNRTSHAGSNKHFKIPEKPSEGKKLLRQAKKYSKSIGLEEFYDAEGGFARFNGKMRDKGSIALAPYNEEFHAFMDEHFSGRYKAVLTGAPVMMDNTHAFIVRNVIRGLIGAVIIIGIIMGFLFRSWRIVLISLLTNIIPLLITGGIMAVNGIEMKLSTSIIFIIAFGIAVDDSIHFLSKFNRELGKGQDLRAALKKTFLTTGKAMIVTTLILSGGFLTLSMSEFLGTAYLGIYISFTLFIALLADLMILPTALAIFLPKSAGTASE